VRSPFDVLVMSEESRLGRESIETAYALKQLVQAGVRVFFYLEDRERTLDSPTDKVMLSLTAFADELEREKARQRTYDAMRRKALAGHVTGGRCFGYDNVRDDGVGVRRVINDAEAAVIRRIYQLCADGYGQARIAKALNEDRAVAPRSQQGRPRAWAPSSVHEVLNRPLYRGRIVWNRSRKRDRWGQTRQHARPEAEWIGVDAPELRIVPEPLWQAAQARRDEKRAKYLKATGGQRHGRPRRDVDSKYLLPGFARCTECGGGLCVRSRSHGGHRMYFYGCTSYWKRGRTVCPNNLEVRMQDIDDAVLTALAGELLAPDVVGEVVSGVLQAFKPEASDKAREQLEHERQRLDAEIERLAEAIAVGGELSPLVERLGQRQGRRETIESDLGALSEPPLIDERILERAVRARLSDWRGLLTRQTTHGRDLLRTVLTGPIVFTPVRTREERGYRFRGEASMGQLLAGVVDLPTNVASPTGHTLLWKPEIKGKARVAA
jgi:site-specific DNA recombinase